MMGSSLLRMCLASLGLTVVLAGCAPTGGGRRDDGDAVSDTEGTGSDDDAGGVDAGDGTDGTDGADGTDGEDGGIDPVVDSTPVGVHGTPSIAVA